MGEWNALFIGGPIDGERRVVERDRYELVIAVLEPPEACWKRDLPPDAPIATRNCHYRFTRIERWNGELLAIFEPDLWWYQDQPAKHP